MSSGNTQIPKSESPEPTISAAAYFDVVQAARELGLVPPTVLATETQYDAWHEQGASRISRADLLALWQCLERHASPRHYGLLIGQRIAPDTKGLLASWVSQCETLGEALNIFARHIELMSHFERLSCRRVGDTVAIEHTVQGLAEAPVAFSERSLSALIAWARHLTQRRVVPRRVDFVWARPTHGAVYADLFGPQLCFGAPNNRIELDAHWLDAPIGSANFLLRQLVSEQALQALRAMDPSVSLVSRLRAIVQRQIADPELSIVRISEELGVTRQTLYRRLKAEGLTFTDLRDQVRQEQARLWLQERAVSNEALSEQLGFRDVSAFNKAFRRWFNMTPAAYRRRLAKYRTQSAVTLIGSESAAADE